MDRPISYAAISDMFHVDIKRMQYLSLTFGSRHVPRIPAKCFSPFHVLLCPRRTRDSKRNLRPCFQPNFLPVPSLAFVECLGYECKARYFEASLAARSACSLLLDQTAAIFGWLRLHAICFAHVGTTMDARCISSCRHQRSLRRAGWIAGCRFAQNMRALVNIHCAEQDDHTKKFMRRGTRNPKA